MATGGTFNNGPIGTTSDSVGGVFNNVDSSVSAAAAGGSGNNAAILALIAAETAARIAGDNALGDRIAQEIIDRTAADALQDTEIATKQDNLVAGTNITLTPNGNDTTTITAAGGGGTAPITTTYTLRLDFDDTSDQPTVVVNTGEETPVVDFNANSITNSEIPTNSDVNVNGVPFILNTDYMISGGILQFTDYTLVPRDGDVIVISAITVL